MIFSCGCGLLESSNEEVYCKKCETLVKWFCKECCKWYLLIDPQYEHNNTSEHFENLKS